MLECPKRQELVKIAADGSRVKVSRCAEQRAGGTFQQDVTSDICAACPIRLDLIKEVKKRGAAPVKFAETHRIRSATIDRHPPARWASCEARRVVLTEKCCGTPQLVRVCYAPDSPFTGQALDALQCKGCPVRRPGSVESTEGEMS